MVPDFCGRFRSGHEYKTILYITVLYNTILKVRILIVLNMYHGGSMLIIPVPVYIVCIADNIEYIVQ